MSYYDSSDNDIILRNPLSSAEIEICMSSDEVKNRLFNNENPILLSIEKWERVHRLFKIISFKKNPEFFFGELKNLLSYKTCALCIDSLKRH